MCRTPNTYYKSEFFLMYLTDRTLGHWVSLVSPMPFTGLSIGTNLTGLEHQHLLLLISLSSKIKNVPIALCRASIFKIFLQKFER